MFFFSSFNSIVHRVWNTQWLFTLFTLFKLWNVSIQTYQYQIRMKNQIIEVFFSTLKDQVIIYLWKIEFLCITSTELFGLCYILNSNNNNNKKNTLLLIKRENNFIYFFVCCLIDNFTFASNGMQLNSNPCNFTGGLTIFTK